jgi:hypothetical protein
MYRVTWARKHPKNLGKVSGGENPSLGLFNPHQFLYSSKSKKDLNHSLFDLIRLSNCKGSPFCYHNHMQYILILLCLTFSLTSTAQVWGTVFPTEKEVLAMDNKMLDKRIVVQNFYYPKPGKFDEALALRIEASTLLEEFGFATGKVLVNRQTMDRSKGKEAEVASILWQVEYESLESLKKEMNSWTPIQVNRFQKEILSKMNSLVDRFKRTSNYVAF